MRNRSFIYFLLITLTACSCDPDKTKEKANDEYNRSEMLSNIGEKVILPAFNDLAEKLKTLDDAADLFSQQTDPASLTSLKDAFRQAYLSAMMVANCNFGPATSFNQELCVFPNDGVKLEELILANNTAVSTPAFNNYTGFGALDYLLYHASEDDVITEFKDTQTSSVRKELLTNMTGYMHTRVDYFRQQWDPAIGNYLKTFSESTGNGKDGSVSLLVNNLNIAIETTKNYRIATPAGYKTLNVTVPDNSEAYFSGMSIDLMKANVQGVIDVFMGGQGKGLDDYLNYLHSSEIIDKQLGTSIHTQLEKALTLMDAINGPFSVAVDNAQEQVKIKELYEQFTQQILPLTKAEMPSACSVSISYSDNDGD